MLHSVQMRSAITFRLSEDLAAWLDSAARKSGISQGELIREQLEKARSVEERPFMKLAGRISGSSGWSQRKGFSTK